MQRIFISIAFYIILAAVGMAIANKKVSTAIAKQRWLKFSTYVIITATVMAAIYLGWFFKISLLIAAVGYYEILKTMRLRKEPAVIALGIYTLLASGFLLFAFNTKPHFQFFLYFQILTFDAFCQITGQLFGRTALAPRISPSKTWEGLAGGTFFCVLSSILAGQWLGINTSTALLLGLVTAVTALAGDLLASYYKRMTGIKDFSNLLKGQGGFLDRFDSLVMSGFSYFFIYSVLLQNPVSTIP
jgi:phosphatidate cytidylyltransferase